MTEQFSHNEAAGQFEAFVDGQPAGVCSYHLDGAVAVFDHTEVPPEFGGRGIAGRLVTYAMDSIRAAGAWKVRALCPYVSAWLAKHPDYADLLA